MKINAVPGTVLIHFMGINPFMLPAPTEYIIFLSPQCLFQRIETLIGISSREIKKHKHGFLRLTQFPQLKLSVWPRNSPVRPHPSRASYRPKVALSGLIQPERPCSGRGRVYTLATGKVKV